MEVTNVIFLHNFAYVLVRVRINVSSLSNPEFQNLGYRVIDLP